PPSSSLTQSSWCKAPDLTALLPTTSELSPCPGFLSWKKLLNVSATSWCVISSKIIGNIVRGSAPSFPKLWVRIVVDGSPGLFLTPRPTVFITLNATVFRRGVGIVIVARIVRSAQAHGVFPAGLPAVVAHGANMVRRA